MLAGLGEDGLHLCGEQSVLVMGEDERGDGGDAVGDLDGAVVVPWLDREHVHSGPEEEIVVLVVQAEVDLRGAAVLDVVGGGAVRACRIVLHLPDGRSREGERVVESVVKFHLRSTAERSERRSCVEGEHVRHVSGHRMPGLACRHQPIIPADGDISLTKTKHRGSGDSGKTIVEVSLDLCSEFQAIIFITSDIESDSGSDGGVAEGTLLVQIDIALLVLVFRKIVEEVFCSGHTLTCVKSIKVADETVKADLRFGLLGAKSDAHCQSGKRSDNFVHFDYY